MHYFNGTLAYGTTGIQSTIPVGFQPVVVKMTVGQKFGTSQSFSHLSVGSGTPSSQHVDSFFQDSTGGKTVSDDTKAVSHYERVSGTITEVLSMKIDSFSSTGLKLNVLTANPNYNVYLEVWG